MPEIRTPSDNNGHDENDKKASQWTSQEKKAADSQRAPGRSLVVSQSNVVAPEDSGFSKIRKAIVNRLKTVFGSWQKQPEQPKAEPSFAAAAGWAAFRAQGPNTNPNSKDADKAKQQSRFEKFYKDSDSWKLAGAVTLAVGLALWGWAVISQTSPPDGKFNKYASKIWSAFWKTTGYQIYQEQRGVSEYANKLIGERATLSRNLERELSVSATTEKKLDEAQKKLLNAEARIAELEKNGRVAKNGTTVVSKSQKAQVAAAKPAEKSAKVATPEKPTDYVKVAEDQQKVIDRKLKELHGLKYPNRKPALEHEWVPQKVVESKDYKSYVREQQRTLTYLNKEIGQLAKGQEKTRLAAKSPEAGKPDTVVSKTPPSVVVSQNPPAVGQVQKDSPQAEVFQQWERSLLNSGLVAIVPAIPAVAAASSADSSGTSKAAESKSASSAWEAEKKSDAAKPALPAKTAKAAKTMKKKQTARKRMTYPAKVAGGLTPGKIKKKDLLGYLDRANAELKSDKRLESAHLTMKEVTVKGEKAFRIFLNYEKDGKGRKSYLTLPPGGESRNYSYVRSVENTKRWAERKLEGKKARQKAK